MPDSSPPPALAGTPRRRLRGEIQGGEISSYIFSAFRWLGWWWLRKEGIDSLLMVVVVKLAPARMAGSLTSKNSLRRIFPPKKRRKLNALRLKFKFPHRRNTCPSLGLSNEMPKKGSSFSLDRRLTSDPDLSVFLALCNLAGALPGVGGQAQR